MLVGKPMLKLRHEAGDGADQKGSAAMPTLPRAATVYAGYGGCSGGGRRSPSFHPDRQ
jgi:hypothetical protein